MIKVQSIKLGNQAEIVAFADSKDDVTDPLVISGLPDNVELAMGSSIITADGDIAFLKSDGTWNWIGE